MALDLPAGVEIEIKLVSTFIYRVHAVENHGTPAQWAPEQMNCLLPDRRLTCVRPAGVTSAEQAICTQCRLNYADQ